MQEVRLNTIISSLHLLSYDISESRCPLYVILVYVILGLVGLSENTVETVANCAPNCIYFDVHDLLRGSKKANVLLFS